MSVKTYNKREFAKLLSQNGYFLDRVKGSHFIYKNGTTIVSVPKNLNKMISLRLIKEYNLCQCNV